MREGIRKVMVALVMFFWMVSNVSADSEIKYVAIGDSITTGYGLGESEYGFVELVAKEAGYKRSEVLNKAVNGATIDDVVSMLDSDEELKRAIRSAKLLTLTAGGNDMLGVLYEEVLDVREKTNPSETLDSVKAGIASGQAGYLFVARSVLMSDTIREKISEEIQDVVKQMEGIISRVQGLNQDIEIIIAKQYNPYLVFEGDATLGLIYELFDSSIEVFNEQVDRLASVEGVDIASVASAFENHDKPESLLNATLEPLNIDIHPNKYGHKVIALAIDEAWEREVTIYFKVGSEVIEGTIWEDTSYVEFSDSYKVPCKDGYDFLGYYIDEDDTSYLVNTLGYLTYPVAGFTDDEGNYIGSDGITLYGVFEKVPSVEICEVNGSNCVEVYTSNKDILGDGKAWYDADKKILELKDGKYEKTIVVYEDGVTVILDNVSLSDGDASFAGINGKGDNLTVRLKGNNVVDIIYYERIDGSLVISGDGVLDNINISGSANKLMEVRDGVVVNSRGIDMYGLMKISGVVNINEPNRELGIISDKVLITKSGKVRVDGVNIGIFAYGDYVEYLDNSRAIELESGSSYVATNTDIALAVNAYFGGSLLDAAEVIVLPEGYLLDNQEVVYTRDTDEYDGYYIYTIGKKGKELSVTYDEKGDLVVSNAVSELELGLDNLPTSEELVHGVATGDLVYTWVGLMVISMIGVVLFMGKWLKMVS